MPIDRGPWTALIDDDGSNQLGSPWSKSAIKTVILDPVDAAIAAGAGLTYVSNNVAGTWHDLILPGRTANTYWEWASATDLTLTGIAGGAIGHRLTIKHAGGAGKIVLPHTNTGSVAGNRLTNIATSAATPIGAGGWATYAHNGSAWVLIDHEQGAAITAPFAAGNFTGVGATWAVTAGNVTALKYKLAGRLLTVIFSVGGTSLDASATQLVIGNGAWGGFLTAVLQVSPAVSLEAAAGFAYAQTDPGGAVLRVLKVGTAWAASTGATGCYGTVTLDVN